LSAVYYTDDSSEPTDDGREPTDDGSEPTDDGAGHTRIRSGVHRVKIRCAYLYSCQLSPPSVDREYNI